MSEIVKLNRQEVEDLKEAYLFLKKYYDDNEAAKVEEPEKIGIDLSGVRQEFGLDDAEMPSDEEIINSVQEVDDETKDLASDIDEFINPIS